MVGDACMARSGVTLSCGVQGRRCRSQLHALRLAVLAIRCGQSESA